MTLIAGDVLRPLSIVDALRTHGITKIAHTAANPLLTLGAQKEPYAAINLNIMGTVNVLEAARVTGLKRVVVSSSSVLNHYLEGGEDDGDFGQGRGVPAPDHVLLGDQAGGREPRPQLREVVRHRVRRACATARCSGRGAAPAAADRRISCARRCATRSPGKEATVPPGAMEWVYSKDAARGTVMALDAKDLGSRVFNITMGSLTTPSEMASAIGAAVPGAKVKFDAPAGTGLALSNRDSRADLGRAKRYLGYEPQFKLQDALKDLGDWMKCFIA